MKIKNKFKKINALKQKADSKSLGYYLTWRIAVITTAIVTIMVVFSLSMSYSISIQGMNKNGELALETYSDSVESALEYCKSSVECIAKDTSITPQTTTDELSGIATIYAQKLGFEKVSFILSSGLAYDTDVSYKQSAQFVRATNGETYVTSPQTNAITKKTEFAISTKVNNGTEFNGVVVCTLPYSDLNDIITGVSIGENGYGYILDSNGTIVAHKDPELSTGFVNYIELARTDNAYKTSANMVTEVLSHKEGSLPTKDPDGVKRVTYYRPIEGTDGWILCVVADKGEMMGEFKNTMAIDIPALVIFIIIAFVISAGIAKRIKTSFVGISGTLSELSQGNLKIDFSENNQKIAEIQNIDASLRSTVNSINDYISDIGSTLNSLANNDYDIEVSREYAGDFERIKTSLLSIIDALNRTGNGIGTISHDILDASRQVANTSQLLAQGATEQASAIEELATTISALSEQADVTAEFAKKADESVSNVRSALTDSNDNMVQLIKAVNDINETSNQVAKIVSLIENIAFQTNMLALNAAVEAASAGASGKSFAVVAEEVKSLANKCAEAADDTAALVKNTIAAVERGMFLSDSTAQLLVGVASSVDEVMGEIEIISSDAAEETEELKQAVTGLDQVSNIVQTNSATAEESAAVSEELAGNAQELENLVSGLKLKKI